MTSYTGFFIVCQNEPFSDEDELINITDMGHCLLKINGPGI